MTDKTELSDWIKAEPVRSRLTDFPVQRRLVLKSLAAVLASGAVPALTIRAYAQQAGSHQQVFGDGTLTVVSDGQLVLPGSMVLPESIDRSELSAVLDEFGMSIDELRPDCNITLWRQGDRHVLFDVGAGSHFMPSAGKLLENMEAAGIDPYDITDVVFTHAHPDHLWGVLDDFDELICPDATYHMPEQEWDYWSAGDTLSKTPENRQAFVAGAQNRFPAIEPQLNLFRAGQEVVPGIEAIDTSGHTPGHCSFAVHAGSEAIVVLGDALTNVALSFLKPDWPSGSDQDPHKAVKTRLRLLDRLVAEQSRIVGFHLPHPGLGHVSKHDGGWRFVPA